MNVNLLSQAAPNHIKNTSSSNNVKHLFTLLKAMQAMSEDSPNPVMTGLRWSPEQTSESPSCEG